MQIVAGLFRYFFGYDTNSLFKLEATVKQVGQSNFSMSVLTQ